MTATMRAIRAQMAQAPPRPAVRRVELTCEQCGCTIAAGEGVQLHDSQGHDFVDLCRQCAGV